MSNRTTPAGLFFSIYWNGFWPDQRIWPLRSLTDHKVFQPGLWNSGLRSVRVKPTSLKASIGDLTVTWQAKTRLNDPLPGENQFTGRLEVVALRNKLKPSDCQAFHKNTQKLAAGCRSGNTLSCGNVTCTIYQHYSGGIFMSFRFRSSLRIAFMTVAFQHFVLLFIRNLC